jgi:hypothetical protein
MTGSADIAAVERQNKARKLAPLAVRQARQLAMWAEAMGVSAAEAVARSMVFVRIDGAPYKPPKVRVAGNGIAPAVGSLRWQAFPVPA